MMHDLLVPEMTTCKGWLTALNGLRSENIDMKDRLSAAVSRHMDAVWLAEAEHFLQYFVEQDQVIDLLRYDIHHLLTGWARSGLTDDNRRQYQLLEKDTGRLIAEFSRKRIDFDRFLTVIQKY